MPPTKRKNWKAKILLLFFSILVGLLLAEAGLRIVGFSRPYFYTYDEDLGWTLRPETDGWFRKEGEAYIHINNVGMRDDRDYVTAKSKDKFCIAVLGDSFAEALQLPTAQTFWSLMQTQLQKCDALKGRHVEVLNFGVSSYGTAQELIMLRKRVWQYSPDLVILAFTPANDVRNNSRALEHDELRPYFLLQNGALVEDDSFRSSPAFRQKQTFVNRTLYRLINYSRLLQLINGYRDDRLLRRQMAANQNSNQPPPAQKESQPQTQTQPQAQPQSAGLNDVGVDRSAYTAPKDPTWNDAWLVTEALLVQMNKEANQHGVKFLLVSVTSGPQVNPDISARQSLVSDSANPDLFYVEKRIKALGSRENIPVLTLGEPFAAYAAERHIALHGFGAGLNLGHWNSEGHRLAAQLITDYVCHLTGS